MKTNYKKQKQFLALIFLFFISVNSFGQCWSKVSSGHTHTVAIASNGTLWAWGENSTGQLGDGTQINRYTPVQIGTANNWVDIAAGSNYSVGIRSSGVTGTSRTIYVWGTNYYGETGENIGTFILTPTQIGTTANWQQIAAGSSHVLAIKATGPLGANRFLFAWGRNNHSQLGNGTIINSTIPVQIGNFIDWDTISAGDDFSVAKRTNGKIYTWGYNNVGQLGHGNATTLTAPTQVGTASDWNKISAGSTHILAIKTNGTLFAWGENDYQQLGIGVAANQLAPIQVGTAIDWAEVAAGSSFSLASKNSGALFSWGYNSYGQLGLGTLINTATRTQIGINTSWTQQIDAGGVNGSGIQIGGVLWLWGNNQAGQLGNGNTILNTSPIVVNCPSVLGINEEEVTNKNSYIFPNPISNGTFSVQYEKTIQNVIAFDILGKQIDVERNNDSYIINASFGIYTIKIIDSDGNFQIKKLIIN